MNDLQQPDEAMAAKIEGFGLSHAHIVTSPSFAQTKRSSDDLVAASSTASTPANLTLMPEEWTKSDRTPQAAPKISSPTTPDTPTPLQRRRDIPTDTESTPTKDTSDSKETSNNTKPRSNDMPANGTHQSQRGRTRLPSTSSPSLRTIFPQLETLPHQHPNFLW
jgi:hypothetical protein